MHNGNYTCIARNEAAAVEHQSQLIVRGKEGLRLAGIGRPSFCQVMVMGKSPETTTHGMKTRCPMENLGNSKGWIKGGTERKEEVIKER